MGIEVVPCDGPRGCVDLIDSRGPDGDPLHLTAAEWAEFVAAVKAGGFDDMAKQQTGDASQSGSLGTATS